MVAPDKVGIAIGKGGQNLKNMRQKFSVQLELIQKDSDLPGVARPLKITGSPQQIQACRLEFFQNMLPKEEKTPQKLGPGGQIRVDFPVPQGAVGVIIGKKGETITNLQAVTVRDKIEKSLLSENNFYLNSNFIINCKSRFFKSQFSHTYSVQT